MKKVLITIIPLMSLLIASPVLAAKIKDATCFDVERVTDDITPQYLAVSDGYNKSSKKDSGETVDVGGIVSVSKKINKECLKDNDTKIADIRKDLEDRAATHTSETLNPLKATCQDFMALGQDVQPVAVFWIAGHDRVGDLKKGDFDQKFLSLPISALIQSCKNEPTASLYDKTRLWLKQNI